MQNSPAPWRLCFSTNQYGLKESDRGSSKKHFYKFIWKSANQFWRRRILLLFSFRCHGNQNSAWIPKNWRNSDTVIVRMLSVKFHPNWPTGYWKEEVDARRTLHAGQKATTITQVLRWAKNVALGIHLSWDIYLFFLKLIINKRAMMALESLTWFFIYFSL